MNTPWIDRCAIRRKQLAKQLDNGIAIIPTAPEYPRNGGTPFPFRADSDFYYLTGFEEPEAILVLQIDQGHIAQSILFCRPSHPEREIWDGPRLGVECAPDVLRVDKAYDIASFEQKLPALLANMPCLYYLFGSNQAWESRLAQNLYSLKSTPKPNVSYPDRTENIKPYLASLRLIKDDLEIMRMKRAADISVNAHIQTMQNAKPNQYEYELEATLLYEFRKFGAAAPAYSSIVASGPTACILHSVANDRQILPGDLVLIDAACEYQYYASDITRTWPITGQFSGAQKDIYQLVLCAQLAAIDAVMPGNPASAPHDKAVAILSQGLIDLGLLTETLDTVIEQSLYRRFFMHRTSHWIGLDVHDVGPAISVDPSPILAAGQILTIEPGIYCPNDDDIPAPFRHIGVRIEDEILVTQTGHDNLTGNTPKTIEDIANLVIQA